MQRTSHKLHMTIIEKLDPSNPYHNERRTQKHIRSAYFHNNRSLIRPRIFVNHRIVCTLNSDTFGTHTHTLSILATLYVLAIGECINHFYRTCAHTG